MSNSAARAPSKELSSIDFSSMIGGPLISIIDSQAKAALSTVEFIRSVGFQPDNEDSSELKPVSVSFTYPKQVRPYQPPTPARITVTINDPGKGYTKTPKVTVTGEALEDSITADVSISGGKVTNITVSSDKIEVKDENGDVGKLDVKIEGDGSDASATASLFRGNPEVEAKYQDMELNVPILTMLPIPFIRVEEATIDFNAKISSVEEKEVESTDRSFIAGGARASGGLGLPYVPGLLAAKFKASVNMRGSISNKSTSRSGYNVEREYSMQIHVRAVQDEMPAGMERLLGILEGNIESTPIPEEK